MIYVSRFVSFYFNMSWINYGSLNFLTNFELKKNFKKVFQKDLFGYIHIYKGNFDSFHLNKVRWRIWGVLLYGQLTQKITLIGVFELNYNKFSKQKVHKVWIVCQNILAVGIILFWFYVKTIIHFVFSLIMHVFLHNIFFIKSISWFFPFDFFLCNSNSFF